MNCAKVRGRTWLSVNNNSDHMNINGNSVVKKESSKNKEDKGSPQKKKPAKFMTSSKWVGG